MAFLKDTVVAGDLRVTDTIYGNVPLDDLVDADDLKAIEALTGTSGTLTKTAANTWALSSGVTPAAHAHGNIANGGTMSSTGVAIANGDYLLISDASNSGKIERTSITFDGSTATKALTQKGTWETFNNYSHPTTAGNKHIPSGGSSGQFLGWDSAGTAKWVNNPDTDTKNTAGATNLNSKIYLIGATAQEANPQTYSSSKLFFQNGINSSGTSEDSNTLFAQSATQIYAQIHNDDADSYQYFSLGGVNGAQLYGNFDDRIGIVITPQGETTINGLVAPTANDHAANKQYVDNAISTHTHATSLTTSSGTNQLTLAFGSKYALTAGGTSYIFTMPSNPNTDTKQNITLATTLKAYLTGVTTAPTATANALTGVGDTGVYLTTTAGQINATSYKVNEAVTLEYNSTTKSLDFIFA